MPEAWPDLVFATPRKLPRARDLRGRVVVLDLAFASEASGSGFEKITKPLIDGLGPRLAAWVDHHDHAEHGRFRADPRFVLATKAEHGACPEMVTKDLVHRIGPCDTIVCHTDFDGLCSAAKWIRGGDLPYPEADDDARAIDTRTGTPTSIGQRFDRAIRGRSRDLALLGLIVRHLATGLSDVTLWQPIDQAGSAFVPLEQAARMLAARYRVLQTIGKPWKSVAFVDVTERSEAYDRTLLLLLGQERAHVAVVVDHETLTLAARYDSGINFLELLELSGGMPTLVSVHSQRRSEVLGRLGIDSAEIG